jgi:hypothetical protein
MGASCYERPRKMRSMAEASFAQARRGFEKFLAGAQATAGPVAARAATVRAGPGTPASVMRLHSEFVRAQMRSLAERAARIGQLVSYAAIAKATPKKLAWSTSYPKFRDRNAHPVRVSYAASHLKLHCVAQN